MSSRWHPLAWALLAVHAALIAFSTAAMVTILAAPPGEWATTEPAATIMRVSYRFAGPTYVMLGGAAALAFLRAALGWQRTITVAVSASALALGFELAGTATGLPFGDYAYSGMLGYRVLGLVPFPIPVSWFYMLTGSLVIVARTVPAARTGARRPWLWACLAGLLMLAWDVSMDPAMVHTGHWRWGDGALFRESGLPGWIVSFFTTDAFYGMPLSNWLGWLVTATVIARVMLSIVPPDAFESMSGSRLPVALYLVNGVMPVALCLRDGFWWAAALGALAMALPATIAWRRDGPQAAPSPWSPRPA